MGNEQTTIAQVPAGGGANGNVVWLKAGQHKFDPRDPERRHEWDINALTDDDLQARPTAAADPQIEAPKPKAFILVGQQDRNRPMEKVAASEDLAQRNIRPVHPVRAEVMTDIVGYRDHDGRIKGPIYEKDRPDAYFAESLPVMALDRSDIFNKRRLPTPRRGHDITQWTEIEEKQKKRDLYNTEFQVELDGVNEDRVGYQQLEMLSLMIPTQEYVLNEEYRATGNGRDDPTRDDESYNEYLGRLPAGEKDNLQRIINEY